MKKIIVALVTLGLVGTANAQVLSGVTRLACEAILCLSSGTRPGACSPSLSHYFGINKRKFSDTIQARLAFLSLCPVASQTVEMSSLVSAISRGAGRCDTPSLNATLRMWSGGDIYISDRMPSYCAAYTGHEYTDFNTSGLLPKYVGVPERGGRWVDTKDYDNALAEYNARIAAEDRARYQGGWGWGS